MPRRPVPAGPWGATWLAAAAIALVAVAAIELAMRHRGYRPSVKDDAYAWAWQRARVSDASPRTVKKWCGSFAALPTGGNPIT